MNPEAPNRLDSDSLPSLDIELLAQIIESIADPVFIKDEQHRWVYLNQAFCDFIGHARADLLGRSDYDFFPAAQADIFWQKADQVFSSGAVNVNKESLTDASGRTRTISTKKSVSIAADGCKYLVGVIRDVTEVTRRENYQEQVNRLLQRLVLGAGQEEIFQVALQVAEEELPGAIASILILDKKSQRLYQAVPSRLPAEFSRQVDGTPVRAGMGACGEAAFRRERMIIEDIASHPNWSQVREITSKYNLAACWSQPIFNYAGEVEGTFAVYFDSPRQPQEMDLEILETLAQLTAITFEQQKVERESHQLRRLLADMINAMPSMLIAVDAQGRVLQWNAEAEKMTGVSAADAHGRELGSVLSLSADQLESIYQAIDERKSLSWSKIAHHWAGENHWLDLTLYPVSVSSRAGSVIRVDDVSDQVRIEQMMVQTEKIHSLGGLAAGMAHEINNPLAAILQNVQVMKNRLQKGLKKNEEAAAACGGSIDLIEKYMDERDIRSLLDMVVEAGERASTIVSNMLDFCRKGDARIRLNHPAELMDKTVALLDNDYNQSQRYDFRRVKICRDYTDDLPKIPCEGSNLQQVFFNLLKNAAQAMAMAEVAEPRIFIRMRTEGPWLKIDIEDTGPGMDAETQRRIFEPFYTTKPVGTGTGLGLSVAYFIITDEHKGQMAVDSQPGSGACFKLSLPLNRPDLEGQ